VRGRYQLLEPRWCAGGRGPFSFASLAAALRHPAKYLGDDVPTDLWSPLGCSPGRILNDFAKIRDMLHNASVAKLPRQDPLRTEHDERTNQDYGSEGNSESYEGSL
jgi:hypothetical protein